MQTAWCFSFGSQILTFAELGRTTCLVMTIVFTFNNTAVAGQEPSGL